MDKAGRTVDSCCFSPTLCDSNMLVHINLLNLKFLMLLYSHQHAINSCHVMLFFYLLLHLSYFVIWITNKPLRLPWIQHVTDVVVRQWRPNTLFATTVPKSVHSGSRLGQLCPARGPRAACSLVEGFVRPSVGFRCSIGSLNTGNRFLFWLF